MAQQVINNGESGFAVRTKLNANFAELYERSYEANVLEYGATGVGGTDATAAFVAAMAVSKYIFIPFGVYDVNIDLSALRGYTFRGAGRDITTLRNHGSGPVFLLDNTSGDCKFHVFSDFRVQNRDRVAFPTTDGFALGGIGSNENDFHVFQRLEVLDFRRNFSLTKRHVWCTWEDVHSANAIENNFYAVTDDNIAALSFRQCRFGTAGGAGFFARKDVGDPLASWSFDQCTFEKNNGPGVHVAGTSSGLSGWVFTACYWEENTKTVSAGSTSPRKANVFIEASLCLGLNIFGGTMFGTPDPTPLDWGIYVSSPTAAGTVLGVRGGVFALGFMSALNGEFKVAPPSGGTATLQLGPGSVNLSETVTESLGADTLTLTGCTTSPTGAVKAVKQRNQVTLTLPQITGTSNSSAATLTGLSTGLRPATAQTVGLRITDAGTTAFGLGVVNPDGTITLQTGAGGGAFTNSGTKGVQPFTFTYSLD